MHLDNYESKHGRRIEGFLFLINFCAIVLFIIDTHQLSDSAHSILLTLEFGLVSIFIVEYLSRMWVAEKKIRHFFNMYSIIDLISIVPILIVFVNLGFVRIFRILRIFRVIRVMRVLRLQRMFKGTQTIFGKFTESKLIVIKIILTLFTIILVSSGFIWAIESRVNPEQFSNIWSVMYFSIVTMATVGFGDITPLSPLGKLVTVLMILSGIALIPWQIGKLIKAVILSHTKT